MKLNRLAAAVFGVTALLTASVAFATHSWNGYHWSRNTSSFTLQVIDSNTPDWDSYLNTALSQWSQSTKLNMTITSRDDNTTTRRNCTPVVGKIRSCNHHYGSTGWLGLASINLDSRGHINQGTSKMNDYYSSSFSSTNERKHVMCQELGHTLGLDHTSTDGSSQGSCMDYSQSSASTAPNSHDYNELATIYSHLDSYRSNSFKFVPTAQQAIMKGGIPMDMRISKGVFDETWVASDGKGGIWVTYVTLAPGFEHTELLDNK